MRTSAVSIDATAGGRLLRREQVLAWEDRRIGKAARRIGVPVPTAGDIEVRREALLHAKLELGGEMLVERLGRDLRISGPLARAQAAVSSHRRVSVARLAVTGGRADDFVAWFREQTVQSNEPAMLRVCPDHFVIRTDADGRQEVIETTGGSPLTAAFLVDYTDSDGLVTPAHPDYPHQIAGTAKDIRSGRSIGGVRHQFRDIPGGFEAFLTVEFPLPTMPVMVSGHRWHLACEFSNWIEAALG